MLAAFESVDEALCDLRAGNPVVLIDDATPEPEAVMVIAAEHATASWVNFLTRHARGRISLALTPERCDALQLLPMLQTDRPSHGTAFTVSVEARDGVTTGISARDRATTIAVVVDPRSQPSDLLRPGHVVPIRTRPGGVLDRPRAAEAAVDLTRAAGVRPAGVLCEILADDGSAAVGEQLARFRERHGLCVLHVTDLVAYRRCSAIAEASPIVRLPTPAGDFQAVAFRERDTELCHVAVIHGDVRRICEVPVFVHAECLAGEVFRSLRCDCRERLTRSLDHIARAKCGLVLRLGRGANRFDPLCPADIQESRGDAATTPPRGPWNAHEHMVIIQILTALGVRPVGISGVCESVELNRYGEGDGGSLH